MRRLWRNYSLSIMLGVLFITAWSLQTFAGWMEHSQEPNPDYLWVWLAATMENWESEWLQLLTFVIFTKYFVHKGSHESKDTDEELEEQLNRIEQKLP